MAPPHPDSVGEIGGAVNLVRHKQGRQLWSSAERCMFSLGSHGAVPEGETVGLSWLHTAQIYSKQSVGRFVLGPIPQGIR